MDQVHPRAPKVLHPLASRAATEASRSPLVVAVDRRLPFQPAKFSQAVSLEVAQGIKYMEVNDMDPDIPIAIEDHMSLGVGSPSGFGPYMHFPSPIMVTASMGHGITRLARVGI